MTNTTETTGATYISKTTTVETFSRVERVLWALQDGRYGVLTRVRLHEGSWYTDGWAYFSDLPSAKALATRPSY